MSRFLRCLSTALRGDSFPSFRYLWTLEGPHERLLHTESSIREGEGTSKTSYASATVDDIATLFVAKRKRLWTSEDDNKLLEGLKLWGEDWTRIQQTLPHRTKPQIKQRWVRSLKTARKYGRWDSEEDTVILNELQTNTLDAFAAASKKLEVRHTGQIHNRYRYRWKPELVSAVNNDAEGARPGSKQEKLVQATKKAIKVLSETPNQKGTYRRLTPFTAEEDARLRRAYYDYGNKWHIIVRDFPGRSVKEVFARWWRVLCIPDGMKKRAWSNEEDELVLKGYDRYVQTGRVWIRISQDLLPRRTPAQICARWKKITPTLSRGRWSQAEHEKFIKGLEKWGDNFPKIRREFLPNRTTEAVRTHYYSSIHRVKYPALWTSADDAQLLNAIDDHGRHWAFIAREFFPNRTSKDLHERWLIIEPRFRKGKLPWTAQDDQELIESVAQLGLKYTELGLLLRRAPHAIRKRCAKLAIENKLTLPTT
ncbi:uncharacterized protein SPPG_06260 [Spizellomyces punctatus DAOM BR117]|uniref:Myb-like DNA-binding domain-containing protein n=1 Tax=Spizellomyces punctatus (strain DAOM BR117) TaxID=645134 RepID=A0A0L0HAK7_SPIPD|nr:uncharacterized protein SPPG_06260 [Spizellomyces punctatus DAOM BR117]KNC98575.1 hypothetical protein SPPG_06260 [Spizellomyces punctatus DAOM BR117]|eukprot:XP_016606615.1 hypothetical protein SPPG_06260 [Spizellomyces punctatus DAOM BR117]